jgi:hypothetical protein
MDTMTTIYPTSDSALQHRRQLEGGSPIILSPPSHTLTILPFVHHPTTEIHPTPDSPLHHHLSPPSHTLTMLPSSHPQHRLPRPVSSILHSPPSHRPVECILRR